MSVLSFNRWDYLATKVLVGGAVLVTAATAVIAPLIQWLRDEPLHWDLTVAHDAPVPRGVEAQAGVTLSGTDGLRVTLPQADAGPWIASLLPGALLAVAVAVVGWLLLRLLRATEAGQPFTRQTVRSLRVIAITVFVATLAITFAEAVADSVIAGAALLDSVSTVGLTFSIPLVPLAFCVLLTALAEAFARGAVLQDDVEGLV